jgi:hypothetical protein
MVFSCTFNVCTISNEISLQITVDIFRKLALIKNESRRGFCEIHFVFLQTDKTTKLLPMVK